ENIDDLIDDDLLRELSQKKDLSPNQLIDYIQQDVTGFSIDKEVLETYPKVKEYLINYFDNSRNADEIEDLTNKITKVIYKKFT
ncbi:MAG: hypothetical protein ACKPKO_49770, partial [Candidatus Fonsibacter sp.]